MQSQQNSHPLYHQVILIPLQLPLIYLNCHTFLERNRPKTCAYTVLFLIVLTPSFLSQKFVTDGNRFAIYHSYNCHILPNRLHVIPSLTIFNGQLTANWFCLVGVLFLFYHSLNTWKRVLRQQLGSDFKPVCCLQCDHLKSREIPSWLHSVADILVMQSSSSTVLPSVTVASASWEPVSWTCPSQMPHHMTHFDSEEQWLRDNLALVESPKASWSWLKSRPSAFAVIPMITGIQLLQLWWNRPHGWAFTHGAWLGSDQL